MNFTLSTQLACFITGVNTFTHCSCLNIHISQKNRALRSWFGRPISKNSTGQSYQFFYLKIHIYYSHFPSIFAGVVKSSAFCTLLMLFPKGWIIWVMFLRQIAIQVFQLFGIASTVCKKHWIWQLLQKIEGKWE